MTSCLVARVIATSWIGVCGLVGCSAAHAQRRDDVTLANPLGPPRRGPADVDKAIAEAAAHFSGGTIQGFEEVSRYSTADLGYVVHIERTEARLAAGGNMNSVALRVTMIFRREGDTWKVVHRHADSITTSRPISTVIQT
jgi:ketosteroid isomerase-like protein